jgi:hypothetical protein
MERCVGKAFHMSHSAITRTIVRTIGAYIPAVFLGLYLQSSTDVVAARTILLLLPIVTLSIARSRTIAVSDFATPRLVAVPQTNTEIAEPIPALSFISRAS